MTVGWRYDRSLAYEPDVNPNRPPDGADPTSVDVIARLVDGLTVGGIDGPQAPQFAAHVYRTLRR